MSRHEQLTLELKRARQEHATAPDRGTFDRMRGAANTLNQWNERHAELKEQRRKAALLFREDEVRRLDALLARHALPHNPIGGVSLVDTAGTLRLDLNGRRTFLSREQGLELLAALGKVLS
jgi:hypothetical protein